MSCFYHEFALLVLGQVVRSFITRNTLKINVREFLGTAPPVLCDTCRVRASVAAKSGQPAETRVDL